MDFFKEDLKWNQAQDKLDAYFENADEETSPGEKEQENKIEKKDEDSVSDELKRYIFGNDILGWKTPRKNKVSEFSMCSQTLMDPEAVYDPSDPTLAKLTGRERL